jgi:CMP-N-acetylneuraminic acid synthetase
VETTAPSIAALVPMRHHSERVPGKNYREFDGDPLYSQILATLQDCSLVSAVVVNTDSPTIKEGLNEQFSDVRIIDRPEHLRAGTTPMNDVLLHDVEVVDADFYLQTHSTNPLLQPDTVTQAIETFLERYPEYDSLFSVTEVQTRLWDELARAVNHNPNILLRTQDLPPLYEENSCLYLFTEDILKERHNRIGRRPYLFEIDRREAIDIDEEIDFRIAELMYQELHAEQDTDES